jgi:hypothetical protein
LYLTDVPRRSAESLTDAEAQSNADLRVEVARRQVVG